MDSSVADLLEKYHNLVAHTQGQVDKSRTEGKPTRVSFFNGSLGAYKKIVDDLEKLALQDTTHMLWDMYVYFPDYDSEFPFRPVALGLSYAVALREANRLAEEHCPDGYHWVIHPGSDRGRRAGVGQIKSNLSTHIHADILMRGVQHAK